MVFKQATGNEMTFEQLKNCLLQIETEKNLEKKKKEVAPKANFAKQVPNKIAELNQNYS